MTTQHVTVAIEGLGRDAGETGVRDVLSVESAVSCVPGVVRVYVNPATEMAYVEYDAAVTNQDGIAAQIRTALGGIGLAAGEWSFCSYEAPLSGRVGPQESAGASRSSTDSVYVTTGYAPQEAANVSSDHSGIIAGGKRGRIAGRSVLFTALVVALGIVVSGLLFYSGAGRSNEYTLEMNRAGFRPAALVIPAGEPVAITVRNTEAARSVSGSHMNGLVHQFAIDELGLDVKLAPGQSQTITLPPMQPGTYHYYCNQCCGGKQNMDMLGALIVH